VRANASATLLVGILKIKTCLNVRRPRDALSDGDILVLWAKLEAGFIIKRKFSFIYKSFSQTGEV